MTQVIHEPNPFIKYLLGLASNEDRGALAALRRGLGNPPGTTVEMFRFVEPFLQEKRSIQKENAYYLIAALFALHPKTTDTGNIGKHMAAIADENSREALDRRFVALLSSHTDDLPRYLRQAISLLKSKDIPVNWNQLLRDLQGWGSPERWVQKSWARAFWGRPASDASENTTEQTN